MKEYHLRQSTQDLQQLRQLLVELKSMPAAKPKQAHRARSRLADALVIVEHLIVERLGGKLHERAQHSCGHSYEHCSVNDLQNSLKEVISLAISALPNQTALDPLVNDVQPAITEALQLAVALHRRLDPAFAADEDRESEVATPLRYRTHERARELSSCPHCDASLSAGARTFVGSYCENCRTSWDEEE